MIDAYYIMALFLLITSIGAVMWDGMESEAEHHLRSLILFKN